MHQIRIAPSILAADFARLGEEVQAIERAGADLVHFDVMDNHYVPNLTVGPAICRAIHPWASIPIDVHLMVEPVDNMIQMFAEAGATCITFHPEASRHPHRSLQLIKDKGCKCGLALNPGTPLSVLEPLLHELDMILLMTVNPGFGGQAFIPAALPRIHTARKLLDTHTNNGGQRIALEVDGGIKTDNIAAVVAAGADTIVAGSAIFGAPDANGGYQGIIDRLKHYATQSPGTP